MNWCLTYACFGNLDILGQDSQPWRRRILFNPGRRESQFLITGLTTFPGTSWLEIRFGDYRAVDARCAACDDRSKLAFFSGGR
jgi:hypothetical protein